MHERHFLDWSRPCLESVSVFLTSKFKSGNILDLSNLIITLPGKRAGRRLLEYLVDDADKNSLLLIPPSIVTVSGLIEQILTVDKPIVSHVTRKLLIAKAILNVDIKHRQELIKEALDKQYEVTSPELLEQAEILQTLFQELSNTGLSESEIRKNCLRHSPQFNINKLNAIYEIRKHYLNLLKEENLCDINEQLQLLAKSSYNLLRKHIVLISIIDLPKILTTILNNFDVDILIHANQEHSSGFDELGRINIDYWLKYNPNIDNESIFNFSDYKSIALAIRDSIIDYLSNSNLTKAQALRSISLGILDEKILPELKAEFSNYERLELPEIHYSAGNKFSNSSIFKLLFLIDKYLKNYSYNSFAELIRHPAISNYLTTSLGDNNLINKLNKFQNSHLQHEISKSSITYFNDYSINELQSNLENLLSPLINQKQLNLSQYAFIISDLLQTLSLSNETTFDNISEELIKEALAEIAYAEGTKGEKISQTNALSFILNHLASFEIREEQKSNTIEALGLLELHLDDAPILLIAPANEGFLPSKPEVDPLFPNSLRNILGLTSFESRLASEKYHLGGILFSRNIIRFYTSRVDQNGEFLKPSRHLLIHSNLANRINNFYTAAEYLENDSFITTEKVITLPRPTLIEESIIKVSATSFKTYLTCPYLFYLKHIIKLEETSDAQNEMDSAAWGSLIHEILAVYGKDAHSKNLSDQNKINNCLQEILHALAKQKFGTKPFPAVKLQIKFLSDRLTNFSIIQANRRSAGYIIESAEMSLADDKLILASSQNDKNLLLTAKIDRIDLNEKTGEREIIDYKTNDGEKFDKYLGHYKPKLNVWIDLQLPIYQELVAKILKLSSIPCAGYFWLGRSIDKTKILSFDLEDEIALDARAMIKSVATNISQQIFWPPQYENWPRTDSLSILIDQELISSDSSLTEETSSFEEDSL